MRKRIFAISVIRIYHLELSNLIEQVLIVGPGCLVINLITAFFVGLVFTLQVVQEFIYLNILNFIGAILTIAFIRELSPVLTSIIVISKVGSSFAAELSTMKITEQIDALYLLNTHPIIYLVLPRIIACVTVLPILNLLAFVTSIASSAFICFTLYSIDPQIVFTSSFKALTLTDIVKSTCKSGIFAIIISTVSCYFGLSTTGGTKGVGQSTTISVVVSLLCVLILDFILSYLMFMHSDSSIQYL